MHFLAKSFGYQDQKFAHDLDMGMPIVGAVRVANVLQARERTPTMKDEEWTRRLYERNLQNVERAQKYQTRELAGERLGQIFG